MARAKFGGTIPAWFVTTATPGTPFGLAQQVVVLSEAAVTMELYDGPAGALVSGAALDGDLLDAGDAPIGKVIIPAGDPYIPLFSGPDGVTSLWFQAATGAWFEVPKYDEGSFLVQADRGTTVFDLTNVNTVNVPEAQKIAEFILEGANPPDHKFRFVFGGQQTGSFNQFGELRSYSSSDARVALRCGGRTAGQTAAIFQALLQRDVGPTLFEVTPNNTISYLPVEAPNVISGMIALPDGDPLPAGLASGTVIIRYDDTGGAATPLDITYVNSVAFGNGNAASISGTWPTVQDRDVALLWWTNSTAVAAPSTPTGFILQQSFTADSGSHLTNLYYRVLDGTESGTLTLTAGGSNRHSAVLDIYRNVHSTAPINNVAVINNVASGTSHTCPLVAVDYDQGVVVTAYSERQGSGNTDVTPDVAYTRRNHTAALAAGTGGTYVAVADDGLAGRTIGNYTPGNWNGSVSTDNVVTWSVSLRPALSVAENPIVSTTVLP